MKLFSEKSHCCGCMACADICPKQAVTIQPDGEGFSYPTVQENLCINCNLCTAVCPMPQRGPKGQSLQYFAAQAKDPTLRDISTSGAVFPILAEYVLEAGGVVYGAAFDGSMRLVHQRVNHRNELCRLMRSKYIQSDTVGVFRSVKADLCSGKQVLFIGTPCQAEALRRFLGRKYPNLLLVDLICYGVPSPGVWKKYVEYLEKKHGGRLTEFYFRDKRFCNDGHTISYKINDKEHLEEYSQNPYTSMYFSDCILRPSCHNCRFTTLERSSDMTIGDFWGIGKKAPQMDDGMGTSLIILHSDRGREVWEKIQDKFCSMACSEGEILQPRLVSPTQSSRRRRLFWALYHKLPFTVVIKLFACKRTRRFWYAGKKS